MAGDHRFNQDSRVRRCPPSDFVGLGNVFGTEQFRDLALKCRDSFFERYGSTQFLQLRKNVLKGWIREHELDSAPQGDHGLTMFTENRRTDLAAADSKILRNRSGKAERILLRPHSQNAMPIELFGENLYRQLHRITHDNKECVGNTRSARIRYVLKYRKIRSSQITPVHRLR